MKNVIKKIINAVNLIADLAPSIALITAGLGLIVGGATGTLWY